MNPAIDPMMSGVATPTPAPPPAAAPVPPGVSVPGQTPMPMMAEGGMAAPPKGGSWNQFFRQISWVEAGFMILGTAALLFLIRYYRYRLYADKESAKKMQAEMDDLNAKVTSIETKMKPQAKKPVSFK